MNEFTPQQIASLMRLLERFAVGAHEYLKNNFQGHPEANERNPNLKIEYITDLAAAATLYNAMSGGDLYAAAARRAQGMAQVANPVLAQPVVARNEDEGDDLLTALQRYAPAAPTRSRGVLSQSEE